MDFKNLVNTVNESQMKQEVFNYVEDLINQKFSKKDIKSKIKKKFPSISANDLEILLAVS
jgi:hypothetical protein